MTARRLARPGLVAAVVAAVAVVALVATAVLAVARLDVLVRLQVPRTGDDDGLCDLVETYTQLRAVQVDAAALARSVAHAGSAARLRRFVDRVAAGEDVTVAVLGGSISAARAGVTSYADVLFAWLQRHSAGQHTFVNGAIPATGSSFFRYCAEQQIGPAVDLVLVELAVNDLGGDVNAPGGLFTRDDAARVQVHEEALLRRLLVLPSRPAVVLVHFGWLREYGNAQEPLDALAQFYDVPAISYKNMLFGWLMDGMGQDASGTDETDDVDPHTVLHARLGEILSDRMHPTTRGHAQVGWSLVHFMQTHVRRCDRDCTVAALETLLAAGGEVALGDRRLALDALDEPAVAVGADERAPPGCLSVQGRHPNLRPLQHDADGWRLYRRARPGDTDAVHAKVYWQGTRPGARISFALAMARPRARVYVYALVAPYLQSTAACWVDSGNGTVAARPVVIWSFNNGPSDVAVGVKHLVGAVDGPAEATVTCEMRTGRDFRIIAVLHD